MMKKKRSGIMILCIIYPLIISLKVISVLIRSGGMPGFKRLLDDPEKFSVLLTKVGFLMLFWGDILTVFSILFILVFFLAAILTLQFKKWAKNLFLTLQFIFLLILSISVFSSGVILITIFAFAIPSLAILYYFTRPKVKEQFK